MRSRRGLIVGVSLLFIIVATLAVLTSRALKKPPAFPTTYSEGPYGCKALYMVLKELDLPVERYRRPLKELKSRDAVLVIADPRKLPYTKREIDKLKEWIESGNRLVLFQGPRETLFPKKKGEETEPRGPRIKAGMFNYWSREFGLAVDSDSEFTGRSSVEVSPSRIGAVGQISVSREVRWKDVPDDWTVLAKDVRGPILVTRKMGKGGVTALSDATLPANGFLDKEANLRLVLALLLGPGSPKEILFDEYHHGRMIAGSLSAFIGSSVFLWILLQCLVGGLLFFYTRRARLAGRYRSLAEPVGRSSLEYVQSMANIFASCKAGGAALDAILRRFLVELSRRSGISLKKLEDDSDAGESVIAGGVSPATGELVAQCRRAVRINESPETVLGLARRLAAERESLSASRIRIPFRRR